MLRWCIPRLVQTRSKLMIQSVVAAVSETGPTSLWRGILPLVLAAIVFAYPPGRTATFLTHAFGAYVLLNCSAKLAAGFGFSSLRGPWLGLVLLGFPSIVAGISMLTQPNIGALALAYTIALWAIATGVREIFAVVQARDVVTGFTSIAFALLLLGPRRRITPRANGDITRF
ncbi:MAG: hypothetical protein JWM08_3402 [Candidatus Angelobacter sp.]|nr:hypothetical protein [Candidatus Angelobacter sp.]